MPSKAADIFTTVSEKDYLSLFRAGRPRHHTIMHILEFGKDDVSKAADVPRASVRFDARMPKELEARMKDWAVLLNLVAGHFNGDLEKTALWFTTRNPMLGNVAPRDMVRFGRADRLQRFILNALAENRRPS